MDVLPLVIHSEPDATVAWRNGRPVTRQRFLDEVAELAARFPPGRHVLNACADRYRFAVGLAAALVSERISLLPPSHTPETVRQMKAFAPDVFCLSDGPTGIDLPLFPFPRCAVDLPWPATASVAAVPLIPVDRTVAFVFTSGSTGLPVPHRKAWGLLVRDVRAEAAALLLPPGARPQVVGTVPPQHMYGIESTVLLPWQSGGALSAGHPFYPADIGAALEQLPPPRVLVTTPVHLRALLDAGIRVPPIDLILSATAPLSAELAAAAEAELRAPLQEIYGSTETGQIASRRSTLTQLWTLFPALELSHRGDRCWASGGHVDPPVPLGDVIELAGDGRFLLHGRIGDLVNIAGKRNSLAYLNHQLLAIDGVLDGVFFMPHEEGAERVTRLCAFAVAPGLDAAAVRAGLRQRIDPVFMPRPLVLLEQLPRNSTGKVTRETIEALAQAHLPGRGISGET